LKKVAAEELGVSNPESLAIGDEAISLDRGTLTDLTWERLVGFAFSRRVNLSAQAHYATPGIHFDRQREKGRPFAYHVFGSAVCEATLDCLRGIARVERVSVVHDLGRSIEPLVDRGQMEGGIVQGIGWLTTEELLYSPAGLLTSDSLSTYKVPDLRSVPDEIDLHFLEDAYNPEAVMGSKAVGEPPFMYGIGAYFAIREAMRAFRPDKPLALTTPLTSEKILLFLHG
jgi:xanthine dehydrogenase large subunit